MLATRAGLGENQDNMASTEIIIRGANEHNLRGVNCTLPRDKLIVITGLSGSGKSSLAFDTIYAEGQRRYVESLSAYARQFLGQMQKPDVDHIEGLPPTIAIEQRQAGHNPRSTVATTTEIYDYLRLLYARVGVAHCPVCQREVGRQSAEQMVDTIMTWPQNSKLVLMAPLIRGRKGEHKDVFASIMREGFVRARVDGRMTEVGAKSSAGDKNIKHDIEVVIDRIALNAEARTRLNEGIETALKLGGGVCFVARQDGETLHDTIFSAKMYCPDHPEETMGELEPRLFSFNSPWGACQTCHGLGTNTEISEALVIPDTNKNLANNAIAAWSHGPETGWYRRSLERVGKRVGFDMQTPWAKLEPKHREFILKGEPGNDGRWHWHGGKFPGVMNDLQHRFENSESESVKNWIMRFMHENECPSCNGSRLNRFAAAVTVGGRSIREISAMNVFAARDWLEGLKLGKEGALIAKAVLREIRSRLGFMLDVGIGYLTLDRKSGTLSGGEAQRIRLATQVGSGLVGVAYVLDEPSIGLHQRDNDKLLNTLKHLRDIGNTVIVVEHDEDTIRAADYILDLGPGAGLEGGHVVFAGTADELDSARTLTGDYLSGRRQVELPGETRVLSKKKALTIRGARENNLKNLDVSIPLGGMVCITGVSGSGKSTLVTDILARALAKHHLGATAEPGKHTKIEGLDLVDKVIEIDQSPIGRTPRSNPATYTNVFGLVRDLFAKTVEAKQRGYQPGRFSFNVSGGRCEVCEGQGIKVIEMHFLPDISVVCEACNGTRYNRETLEVKYRGKSIAGVLDMPIAEAVTFFENHPQILKIVKTLADVGLGYVKLGQASTTLSGGEAQRVKLATELARPDTGHTLYILDEPTTGLHFHDVNRLIEVLQRLVGKGNTAVIIEHNLDVIKCADWLIDLGPEGGDAGGQLIAEGPPREVADNEKSYTGQYLKRYFAGRGKQPGKAVAAMKPKAKRTAKTTPLPARA